MTAREHWRRAKEIVADALEEPSAAAQAALVAMRCGGDRELLRDVESLLAQTTGRLEEAAQNSIENVRFCLTSLSPGDRLGAWVVVREIGRGGMGAVYLAKRADGEFEKEVAIKVLKRGTDTEEVLRRFRAERDILARLDHPNIARLLDAGTTEDHLPYFVMDYVKGKSLTEYASAKQLSIAERLKLFRVVCGAVSYAHQNLVIHRDLKPGNILATEAGEVRLLDFGIAKLVQATGEERPDVTLPELRRLTPEYASPEQVKGEPVTTLNDVYSLGVLLYELLTGELPYRLKGRTPAEITRAICEQEPERPSTALASHQPSQLSSHKLLKRDLDNIVLMALRKEPARRYSSVDQLAEDIRRYQKGLPVRAQPDTITYRAAKFVSRHKTGAAAAALILLILIGGIITTTWQWRLAKAERAKAEARFQILHKSSRTMISEIHGALQNLPGTLETRKLLLQRATEQVDALAAEAGSDSRLTFDLATAYQNLGYLPDQPLGKRTNLLQKSIALYERVLASDPRNISAREKLATCKLSLADFARTRDDNEQALSLDGEALALLEAVARAEPSDLEHKETLWNGCYNMALTLTQLGRAEEALAICRRIYPIALELREKDVADSSDHRFRRPYLSRALAAGNLTYLGRYEEAIVDIAAALEENAAVRRKFPLGPYEKLDETVFNERLAIALERSGRFEEAVEKMQRAVTLAERLFAGEAKDFSCRTNAALENLQLGSLLLRRGQTRDSINYLRRAAALYETIVAADNEQKESKGNLARTYGELGYAEAKMANTPEGLITEQKAIRSYEDLHVTRSSNVFLLHDYAEALARIGETSLISPSVASARKAKAFFARSLSLWRLMRDQRTLSAADSTKPGEVSSEIARCDSLLKELAGS